MSHFEGDTPLEHLVKARIKGHKASEDIHGMEAPGHLISGADTARDLSIILLLLWILLEKFHTQGSQIHPILYFFSLAFIIWKIGRSSQIAWNRLARINRLITDEKREIEENREEERDELKEIYRAKGFEGKLLDKVINVLMSDDNKLLAIMLEEELGVKLESFDHPIKQAMGSLVGGISSSLLLFTGALIGGFYGFIVAVFLIISCANYIISIVEKTPLLPTLMWNFSLALLSSGSLYFVVTYFVGAK